MFEVGRLCVKIAGRDAGKKCVILEVIDDNYVMIDGETRRRKCNVDHLEVLDQTVKIKKGASHDEVTKEFEKLGLKVWVTKSKAKVERPRKNRKVKDKPKVAEKKEAKKIKGKNNKPKKASDEKQPEMES